MKTLQEGFTCPSVKIGSKATQHTQSDNYIMILRLYSKTGTKDLSTVCILFKVHPFCIDTASDTF